MRQTTFRTDSDSADGRIAIPLGIICLVRSSFRRYGFYEVLDGFKDSGVPLSKVIENMCINSLRGDFSMNDWEPITATEGVVNIFGSESREQ